MATENKGKVDKPHINGYSLSRAWFDFSFENYDKVSPNHTALFLWFIELSNRLGWPDKFASPASQAMSAIGMKSYNTYKKTFDNLSEWGFVKVIQESKNQWTACIIALSNFNKAQYKALDKSLDKALDKALTNTLDKASECSIKIYESTEQSTGQGTEQSTNSINKLVNLKQENHKLINFFYLRGNPHQIKISEYLEQNCRNTVDSWMMNLFRGMNKTEIYEKLDIEYIGTEFTDENHLRNSFKAVGKNILELSQKNKQPQYSEKFILGAKPKGAIDHGKRN